MPSVIKKLIDKKLVDYIAMDIKTTFEDYKNIIKIRPNIDNIKESIKLIKNSKIDHEFRTTIMKAVHDEKKIIEICEYLGKDEKIYLQNFELSENVIDKSLKSFTKEELMDIQKIIKYKYPNVKVRGL